VTLTHEKIIVSAFMNFALYFIKRQKIMAPKEIVMNSYLLKGRILPKQYFTYILHALEAELIALVYIRGEERD